MLGHSRGAMICSMVAGTHPERVNASVLIDAAVPVPINETALPGQLRAYIDALNTNDYKKRSQFKNFDDAVKARINGFVPLERSAATALAQRGVSRVDNGYSWHHDSKLMLPSEVKLSRSQVLAFLSAAKAAPRVICASEGVFSGEEEKTFIENLPGINLVHVNGRHHLHLCADEATIKKVADLTKEYFLEYV